MCPSQFNPEDFNHFIVKLLMPKIMRLTLGMITGMIQQKPSLQESTEGDEDYIDNLVDYAGQQNKQTDLYKIPIKHYQCHSCDPPKCTHLTVCYNAVQCWKSRVRESTGDESVSRGCTIKTEQVMFMCKTPPFGAHHKRHASGQYRVDCCEGKCSLEN